MLSRSAAIARSARTITAKQVLHPVAAPAKAQYKTPAAPKTRSPPMQKGGIRGLQREGRKREM